MAMDADSVLASFRESHAWEVSEFSVDLYDDPNADSPKSIDLTQWMIATSRSDPKENVRISWGKTFIAFPQLLRRLLK